MGGSPARGELDFTGIVGGWTAESAVSGMGFGTYFRAAFSLLQFSDYVPGPLKTMVFGFIIAVTASYLGVHASGGTQGVGHAATRSVVTASVVMIAANVVLVRLIFFLFPGERRMNEPAAAILPARTRVEGVRRVAGIGRRHAPDSPRARHRGARPERDRQERDASARGPPTPTKLLRSWPSNT